MVVILTGYFVTINANKKHTKYQDRNPDVAKNGHLKRNYNLTLEEYNKMVDTQNNLCYICGKTETSLRCKARTPKDLAVDHCHKTGNIRKLLCTRCNQSLGRMEDSIDLLQAMIDYLKEHND